MSYQAYLKNHAIEAVIKARQLPIGTRSKERRVARVYHLLAKQASFDIDRATRRRKVR